MILLNITGDSTVPLIIEALIKLINTLVGTFGPNVTLLIFASVVATFVVWRLYQEWKNEKEKKALLEEKDRHIQRLAGECRYYKILDLKSRGYSPEEIQSLVVENNFNNAVEAREALERNNNRNLTRRNEQ